MTKNTLVSDKVLQQHCNTEGVDFSQVCTIKARWAESAPRTDGAQSALVRCDLIIRDDGSAVYLDGCMGSDSKALAADHVDGTSNPENLPWSEFVKSVTEMPTQYY